MLAFNVNVAINKEKILLVLFNSKTHEPGSLPQKIKVMSKKRET